MIHSFPHFPMDVTSKPKPKPKYLLPPQERQPLKLFVLSDTHYNGTPARMDKLNAFKTIANAENPHMILHLGDTIDSAPNTATPALYDEFLGFWNQLTPKKSITFGNHDFDYEYGGYDFPITQANYDFVAQKFGQTTEIAGSKFNAIDGLGADGKQALFITVDANYNAAGQRFSIHEASITEAIKDWLKTTLTRTRYHVAFICIHYGPHNFGRFNQSQTAELRAIVENAVKRNIQLDYVHTFFGHNHPDTLKVHTNFGNVFKGYEFPCFYLYNKFVEVTINPDGTLTTLVRNV